MQKPITVALFLPPAHFSPAAIVHGVARYSSDRIPWRVRIGTASDPAYLKRFLKSCDGVITYVDQELVSRLSRLRIATVGYLNESDTVRLPLVIPDEQGIGETGAEHFLARGYQRFGFFGVPGSWSRGRERGFVRRLARSGFACLTTAVGKPPGLPPTWEQLSKRLFLPRWMKRLKPPAAVMAVNDELARAVVDTCQQLGWRVPEDIAVLGVDNDELLCNYAAIGLSSIDRNLEQIGFEAARLLGCLIRGEASKDAKIVVPPGPLVTRRSTEAYAINDPDAAAAARFIHEHGCTDIDVRDVLAAVPVSRSALERKMLKALGRTPAQEIRRVRLAQACQLLTETRLPVADIAARCGFRYRTYLAMTFKKAFGQTPRQYRKKTQLH